MSANFVAILAALLLFVAGYAINLRFRAGRKRKALGERMAELSIIDKDSNSNDQALDVDDLFRLLEEERQGSIFGSLKRWTREALLPVGGLPALRFIILMALVSAAVGAMVGIRVLALPTMITVAATIFAGLFVPYSYIKMKARQRRDKFLDSFPDAIDLVVRAIKAGIPTSESIATAGRELPDPLGSEFARIAQEVAIGVPPDRALSDAAARVRVNDFNFFAVTLMLQRETGGNLAETLENLSALLRKRKEMRLKVSALTSEAKFTSKVIGALPILVISALFFLNRAYVNLLFTDPTAQVFLGIAVALVIIGSIVMGKMVNMEI